MKNSEAYIEILTQQRQICRSLSQETLPLLAQTQNWEISDTESILEIILDNSCGTTDTKDISDIDTSNLFKAIVLCQEVLRMGEDYLLFLNDRSKRMREREKSINKQNTSAN